MSVSSISTPTSAPPITLDAAYYRAQDTSAQQKTYQANASITNPYKDGDDNAVEQQRSQRASLPPGQGTRVDILT